MDIATVLAAVFSSVTASIGGAYWLLQKVIEHRLSREAETYKAELTKGLEQDKAALQRELKEHATRLEATTKREIELQLADRAAERSYEWEAKKRLYNAIGPLRFQMLLSCQDLAGRIYAYGTVEQYSTDTKGYYGRSTLYRLLRPLAIAVLIEHQIAYTDFSVDQGAVLLLRFKKSAFRILSGDEVVGDHPLLDWSTQREHVYIDSVTAAANALVVRTETGEERVMRFDEYMALESVESFEPFVSILDDFDPVSRPLFWLRLVALGAACNSFVEQVGSPIGFEPGFFDVAPLLRLTSDEYICQNVQDYMQRIEDVLMMRL